MVFNNDFNYLKHQLNLTHSSLFDLEPFIDTTLFDLDPFIETSFDLEPFIDKTLFDLDPFIDTSFDLDRCINTTFDHDLFIDTIMTGCFFCVRVCRFYIDDVIFVNKIFRKRAYLTIELHSIQRNQNKKDKSTMVECVFSFL